MDEVNVGLCQVLPHRIGDKLHAKDSLIFHKRRYDQVIAKSKELARKLGICFNPQTAERSKHLEYHKRCPYPWNMMLIDWDGLVYPCCGGEMIFKQKVRSGEYFFGNILKEHMRYFWNNEHWRRLRATCGYADGVPKIPECLSCPRNLCG